MVSKLMPGINEVRQTRAVGFKRRGFCIWHACIGCGRERWVELQRGNARVEHCISCGQKGKVISPATRLRMGEAQKLRQAKLTSRSKSSSGCPVLDEHNVAVSESGVYMSRNEIRTKSQRVIKLCLKCPLAKCVYDKSKTT